MAWSVCPIPLCEYEGEVLSWTTVCTAHVHDSRALLHAQSGVLLSHLREKDEQADPQRVPGEPGAAPHVGAVVTEDRAETAQGAVRKIAVRS